MKELVGLCVRCSKEVYCTDGFLNGLVLEKGNILCFACKDHDPLVDILNQLLEAEKAGVETLDFLLKTYPGTDIHERLIHVKRDEAWSCSGLIAAIHREGGIPSKETGSFTGKVKALSSFEERLTLLNKGQSWVARKIDEALSFGMDDETRSFLLEMKQRHIDNIKAIDGF